MQAAYVYAVENTGREAMAALVVDSSHRSIGALCFLTQSATVREVVIALVISLLTIMNYSKGRVAPRMISLLLEARIIPKRKIYIVWAPAHSDLPGNESAHEVA